MRLRKKIALLSMPLMLALVPLLAESSHPDGNTWASWNPSMKLGFVVGFLQATDTDGAVKMVTCLDMLNYIDLKKVSGERWKDMCLNDKTNDYGGISMGQFVDGVDAFYRDYRHRNLEVSFGLQYVRDQMRGKTQAELDAEVPQWQEMTQKVKH